jgi:hypothetical protein
VPKLYIAESGQESVFELFDDEVTIGRGAANAIQVADSHSSKHHAVIRRVGGRPKLVDLESKNGTRVNGQFLNHRWLQHGDTISIGAASIRYDAADQARPPTVDYRAAPARVPVPVAAARAAPVAAAPAPSYAPAPGYAPPAGHPPAPRPPSRRRDRDRAEDDGDEDKPRRAAARSSNSAAIGILAGAGVLAVIGLLFLMLSRTGTSKNVDLQVRAKRLADQGKMQEAVALIERNADKTDEDSYKSLAELLDSFKRQIANQANVDRGDEAARYYKHEIFNAWVEQHKNGLSNADLARRIVEWREKYRGTLAVMEFDGSNFEPFTKLKELVQQHGGGAYDVAKAEAARKAEVDADVIVGKYGEGIRKWEAFRDAQKTLLPPDEYRAAANRADGKIAEIRQKAEAELQEKIAKAKRAAQAGDKFGAQQILQQFADRVGIAELKRQAEDAKREFR